MVFGEGVYVAGTKSMERSTKGFNFQNAFKVPQGFLKDLTCRMPLALLKECRTARLGLADTMTPVSALLKELIAARMR